VPVGIFSCLGASERPSRRARTVDGPRNWLISMSVYCAISLIVPSASSWYSDFDVAGLAISQVRKLLVSAPAPGRLALTGSKISVLKRSYNALAVCGLLSCDLATFSCQVFNPISQQIGRAHV